MAKLIEKHQQKNKGRGVISFSPEQEAEFERTLNPFRQRSSTIQNNTDV